MTTATTDMTMQEMGVEFDAWKLREFGPGVRTFYSGPMDPLVRWANQEADKLRAELAEAATAIQQ